MYDHLVTPKPSVQRAASRGHSEAVYRTLLEAISQQDEGALREFYDATIDKVYGLALRIAGRPEEAEEVVVEVYLQVWRQAARYDARRGKVSTWLLTICRSRALDCLQRVDRAQTHPDPDQLRRVHCGTNTEPEDLLFTMENDRAVHGALQQLSATQRQLIALAFYKGYSHSQIATFCEQPLGTVKTNIRQAVQQLRDAMNAHRRANNGGSR